MPSVVNNMKLGTPINSAENQILLPLRHLYSAQRNAQKALEMSAYMKNKFPFYGIQSVQRKQLSKQYLIDHGEPNLPLMLRACFNTYGRELQYFVGDWLKPKAKRLGPDILPLLEELIMTQSWWDTVDFLAPSIAGIILKAHPHLWSVYPDTWIQHENMWLRRSALLFQLKYKADTDDQTLFHYCQLCAHEKEFFIQKAMGWALRERSKTNPEAVLKFLSDTTLPKLTVREAQKWLNRNPKG